MAAMDLSRASEVTDLSNPRQPTTSSNVNYERPMMWPAFNYHEQQRFDSLINQDISPSTARHVKAAVKLFEKWLRASAANDTRKIEEIPPRELDNFLVDFFNSIQKPSGQDYTPSSLKNVRSCLELYLKEQGHEADEVTPEGGVIANVSVFSPEISLEAAREIPSYHYTQPKTQSSSLQRHIIAAAKKFHHWLSQRNPPERREMHKIPPAELDAFLAEYFARVKQTSGGEYNPASFGNLRLCLDHNLRNHNYPYSMSRSIEFALSQKVFKERKFKLVQAAKQTPTERPKYPPDN